MRRGKLKIVLEEDFLEEANVLPGRFVLALKLTINGEVIQN